VCSSDLSSLAQLQLNYLIDLMIDSEDFAWPILRQFHAIILQDLEMGRCSWQDQELIAKKKLRHVTRAEAARKQRPQNSYPANARPQYQQNVNSRPSISKVTPDPNINSNRTSTGTPTRKLHCYVGPTTSVNVPPSLRT
jgi:hypothetical protein